MFEYLGNLLFITVCMVLFFCPFVALFWCRERDSIRASKPSFNYFFEKFFSSKESNYLVLVWAASEAVFWFVIPEFLLIAIIFMKVHKKMELIKYDVIGTIIGTIIGFSLHLSNDVLIKIPYVTQGMVEQVHHWYSEYGIFGLIFQPFTGVPYKLFTAAAPDYIALWLIPLFIIFALMVRMIRYILIYQLSVWLYPLVRPLVRAHYAWILVAFVIVFSWLLLDVVGHYAPGYVIK